MADQLNHNQVIYSQTLNPTAALQKNLEYLLQVSKIRKVKEWNTFEDRMLAVMGDYGGI